MHIAQPAEKAIGRHLSDAPLARIAPGQVLAHRFKRDVIKLAQAIGPQDRVGRVNGGGGVHIAISMRDRFSDGRSITERERPRRRGTCRETASKTETPGLETLLDPGEHFDLGSFLRYWPTRFHSQSGGLFQIEILEPDQITRDCNRMQTRQTRIVACPRAGVVGCGAVTIVAESPAAEPKVPPKFEPATESQGDFASRSFAFVFTFSFPSTADDRVCAHLPLANDDAVATFRH